jgi:hypothetical protein
MLLTTTDPSKVDRRIKPCHFGAWAGILAALERLSCRVMMVRNLKENGQCATSRK